MRLKLGQSTLSTFLLLLAVGLLIIAVVLIVAGLVMEATSERHNDGYIVVLCGITSLVGALIVCPSSIMSNDDG